MATYKYTGEDDREFPTLGLTVKAGDTFDAPSDFVSYNVISAQSPKEVPVAPTVGDN